jgi:hypothetical protein
MRTLGPAGLRILIVLLAAATLAGWSVEARKALHLQRGEDYFKAGDYEKAKIEYMTCWKWILRAPRFPISCRHEVTQIVGTRPISIWTPGIQESH